MKVLFIATRSPYPPRDGGEVLMAATIDGLTSLGHDITVVAPRYPGDAATESSVRPPVRLHLVDARRRPLAAAFAASVMSGRPLSVERHLQPRVTAAVQEMVRAERFDVVHVEQPQAVMQAAPALERKLPVVMRAQNVESELWRMLGAVRPALRFLAAREARRLARWETESAARVGMTLALTQKDAGSLQRLAPRARIRLVRVPMPAELPAHERTLPGAPCVVLLASGRWFPNRDGVSWFLGQVWPGVARALPDARLHVFGIRRQHASGPAVQFYPAPDDSGDAFSRGSILAVPLRIASGARVRILEAWARGVPVVATPAAASGLDVSDGRGLLVARTADEFAAAFRLLVAPDGRARQVVEEGRAALREWHDPRQVALELEKAYVDVIGVSAGRTD